MDPIRCIVLRLDHLGHPRQDCLQLEAFEEYLPCADSNPATVTLALVCRQTGRPPKSMEPHSQSGCAWERDHVVPIARSLQSLNNKKRLKMLAKRWTSSFVR